MSKYHKSDETWYDLMQVCENGHKITGQGESHPEQLLERCTKCGAATLTACSKCGTTLQGYQNYPRFFGIGFSEPPEFCRKCGSLFPWAGKGSSDSPMKEPLIYIEYILDRFHLIARQLGNRHANRPTLAVEDEYDVQYLLHALLRLDFDDIRAEEWTPSYAGGCSRIDFLLKREQVVVEAKKTSEHVGAKQVEEQLLVDIARYAKYPVCKALVCFVYDPAGRIGDPKGLKADLESRSSQSQKVFVHIRP